METLRSRHLPVRHFGTTFELPTDAFAVLVRALGVEAAVNIGHFALEERILAVLCERQINCRQGRQAGVKLATNVVVGKVEPGDNDLQVVE